MTAALRLRPAVLVAGALVACSLGPLASAQWPCVFQEQAFNSGNPSSSGDEFGDAFALHGERLLVGAPHRSYDSGYVFVYTREALRWTQRAQLGPSGPGGTYRFGTSVALDGTQAIVGAPQADGSAGLEQGAVYVFDGFDTTWTLAQALRASDGEAWGGFGARIALDGDRLAISSGHSVAGIDDAGAIYIFERQAGVWNEVQKLAAFWPQANEGFSPALLRGDTLFVSAASHTVGSAVYAGALYVFTRVAGTWQETALLTASDPQLGANFGSAVAWEGTTLLVGASGWDSPTSDAGRVYAYSGSGSTWTEQQRFSVNCNSGTYFGRSLALAGDRAFVGATGRTDPLTGQLCGSFFQFERTNGVWHGVLEHVLPAKATFQHGGRPLLLAGDTLMVGATAAGNVNGGWAFSYRVDSVTGTYCTAQTNSQGCVPQISIAGSPSYTSGAPCVVGASGLVDGQSGLFLYSKSGPATTPFHGGLLCVRTPLVRTAMQNSGGSGPCAGTFAYDLNARIRALVDPGLIPGALVWGQFWSRDPGLAPPDNTNLTDAMYAIVCP